MRFLKWSWEVCGKERYESETDNESLGASMN